MFRWRSLPLLTAWTVALSSVGAQEKTPDIKDIMGALHKGPECLRAKLARGMKSDSPDWDALQRETRDFVKLAEAMSKQAPPKGDKASWEKLTRQFTDQAKAMDQGARDKNLGELKAAHARMSNCKPCHTAHKP